MWPGIPISLRLFHTEYVVIHTVKGFSTVNEPEVDVFLEFPSILYEPVNVGNLLSDSSNFSKPSLNMWKFMVHIILKPSMQDCKYAKIYEISENLRNLGKF